MSWFSKYFYSQALFPYASKAMEFVAGSAVYAGSYIFSYLELMYIRDFDTKHRQIKATDVRTDEKSTVSEKWENPEIVGENRRSAHTVLHSFRSADKALKYWSDEQVDEQVYCNKMLLTGYPGLPNPDKLWQFLLVGSPVDAPHGWELRGFDTSTGHWSDVSLPAHWQCQGFDIPIYTNTVYPFRFDPPRARRDGAWAANMCDSGIGGSPPDPNETTYDAVGMNATGLYRHEFFLPEEWEVEESNGNRGKYFLVFEGVDSALSVWLNGKYVGYSQDSCLPVEFDITEILMADYGGAISLSQLLACRVTRWSDGSYLEDQDKWWLSGIYREVYIVRKPSTHRLGDYELNYTLNWSNVDGSEVVTTADIEIHVLVEGDISSLSTTKNRNDAIVSVQIFDLNANNSIIVDLQEQVPALIPTCSMERPNLSNSLPGVVASEKIVDSRTADHNIDIKRYDSTVICIRGTVVLPHLWTAEDPYLYSVVIKVVSADATDIDACRFGFREVRIGGPWNTLQINRKTVTIAGVNRNEFDCRQGRAVSKATMKKDVMLLKQLNFNAIRTSHYPAHHYLLELCDAAGIYVVDEANIETHGFQVLGQAVGYLSSRSEWMGAFLSRLSRMFERDKNCTCVIGWSLGNESGVGAAHEAMATWIRKRESSGRYLQYESGGACTNLTDIICPMYRRPDWCVDRALNDPSQRPVILCEYSHAMGNSAGGLHHYWSLFHNQRLPRLQGGFIWDLVDQGFNLESEDVLRNEVVAGSQRYKYGGDFGDIPNSRQFCINGILGPQRELHPIAYEAANLQAPIAFELSSMKPSNDMYLTVLNRRCFIYLSDITIKLSLGCNQYAASRRYVEIPLQMDNSVCPGGKITLQLKAYWPDLMQNMAESRIGGDHFCIEDWDDAWLDVIAVTNVSTRYVPSNHTVYCTNLRHDGLKSLVYDCIKAFSDSHDKGIESINGDSDCGSSAVKNLTPKQIAKARASFLSLCQHDKPNIGDVFWSKWKEFEEAYGDKNTYRDVLDIQKKAASDNSHNRLSVSYNILPDGNWLVSWNNGNRAVIGAMCGRIISWSTGDGAASSLSDLIQAPIDICLWRAPTDNDRGGAGFSYVSQWKVYGLDCMSRSNEEASIKAFERETPAHDLVLECGWTLKSVLSETCSIPTIIECKITYTFVTDGSIDINFSSILPSNIPPLPRFGLRFSIPRHFTSVTWFGLGPHEAYDDRKSSVMLGLFSCTVADLHTPYVVPQESGRRAEPRVIEFSGPFSKQKLIIKPNLKNGDSGWGWSASKYSLEHIETAMHNFQLISDSQDDVHVHVDRHSMGLGGYDSWSPNVKDEFLVKGGRIVTGKLSLSVVI